MSLQVETILAGALFTNTYVLTKSNDVIIIDPACKIEKLEPYIKDKNVLAVLLTHGHFDHIKTVDSLYNKYKLPVYIHKDDEYLIRDKNQSVNFGLSEVIYVSSPCRYYEEGKLKIGEFEFNVIFTPGHTNGSVCLEIEDSMFTGDTLFRLSVGRTDLEGGNPSKLRNSLKLLSKIEKDLKIYPGHDAQTRLEIEKTENIFLKS